MIIVNPNHHPLCDLPRYMRTLENAILPNLTNVGKKHIQNFNWFSLDNINTECIEPGTQFAMYDIFERSGPATQLCEVVSANAYNFRYRVIGDEVLCCLPKNEWIQYLIKEDMD